MNMYDSSPLTKFGKCMLKLRKDLLRFDVQKIWLLDFINYQILLPNFTPKIEY
jgi:hypothetical protein